ncbi:hypothetical protein V1477_008329 [Vespula maculifrons]|uniref:Uncharacterized protein n=1 Tax=Vespula maculifrons TaxID=7453 RepID=A0ABD2CDE2_VESMC
MLFNQVSNLSVYLIFNMCNYALHLFSIRQMFCGILFFLAFFICFCPTTYSGMITLQFLNVGLSSGFTITVDEFSDLIDLGFGFLNSTLEVD